MKSLFLALALLCCAVPALAAGQIHDLTLENIEEKLACKQEAAYKNAILHKCLAQLNDREQYIVKHRLLTEEPMTLNEVGEKFGISRERVRQIEEAAFKKLQNLVLLAIKVKK